MRARRTDDNQAEIVAMLRKLGFTVKVLSGVGDGCPDILAGKDKINHLIEIKDGKKPPSQQKLTPDEAKFHEEWKGSVVIINSIEECLKYLNTNK